MGEITNEKHSELDRGNLEEGLKLQYKLEVYKEVLEDIVLKEKVLDEDFEEVSFDKILNVDKMLLMRGEITKEDIFRFIMNDYTKDSEVRSVLSELIDLEQYIIPTESITDEMKVATKLTLYIPVERKARKFKICG